MDHPVRLLPLPRRADTAMLQGHRSWSPGDPQATLKSTRQRIARDEKEEGLSTLMSVSTRVCRDAGELPKTRRLARWRSIGSRGMQSTGRGAPTACGVVEGLSRIGPGQRVMGAQGCPFFRGTIASWRRR